MVYSSLDLDILNKMQGASMQPTAHAKNFCKLLEVKVSGDTVVCVFRAVVVQQNHIKYFLLLFLNHRTLN